MYSVDSLGGRITPKGVDELLLRVFTISDLSINLSIVDCGVFILSTYRSALLLAP